MKKSELTLMIRKVVREEVALAIHEVITELKRPEPVNNKPLHEKKTFSKKKYVKNPLLNDILNETADDGEWRTMGNDAYTTENMNEIAYGNQAMGSSTADIMQQTAEEMNVNPDAVSNLMNKDYRSILKKSYEKSGRMS